MVRRSLPLLALLLLPVPVRAQVPHLEREFRGAVTGVRNVAFSPDGKSVAGGIGADEVRIWDVASGKQTHLLRGGAGSSMAIAFAPDGKRIVTTSWTAGRLFVWGLPEGRKLLTLERDIGGGVHHVAYSPDGKWIASAGNEVRLWDAGTGKVVFARRQPALVCSVAFSPDSKRLASSDHSGRGVQLWDVSTGKVVRTWATRGGIVTGLAFSPDGTRLYAGSHDGVLREWDAVGGKELRRWSTEGRGNARTLSLSPEGRSLAVSTSSGTVQVWEVATLKRRRTFAAHGGFAWGVAFAPDGKAIATGGEDALVRLWDVTDGWARPKAKRLAPTEKGLGAHWDDLAGPDAPRAYTAVWALAASPRETVAFLAKRLEAERSALAEGPKRIARLVRDLDDDDFEVRERASEALVRLGGAARAALVEALARKPSPEQRRQIQMILRELGPRGDLPPEEVRIIRVREVLENIDTAAARKLLASLAKAP